MSAGDLRARVAARQWYHSIELAPELVTPGWFDTRRIAARLPMPDSLAGARCLDVGTFDGFWAFEMERRGADEVVAIDVPDPADWDWPAGSDAAVAEVFETRREGGAGFEIAHEALGSRVRRVEASVYDLGDDEELGGFDFIYLGSLLLHLRDPVGALDAVRRACRGRFLVVDAVDRWLSLRRTPLARLDAVGRPWWWRPNLAGLQRMVESAGFELERPPMRFAMPRGAGQPRPRPTPRGLASPTGRDVLRSAWSGDPHAALLARPL